jgi:hypothetical protein
MAIIPATAESPWSRYLMALEDISRRMERICGALGAAEIPYALVGGQAVALWVATKDPAAVRTTKDVDILLDRNLLPKARAAAGEAGFDYFEVLGVGMFLDRSDPNPRQGVHLVWADERVRPADEYPVPALTKRRELAPGFFVVPLPDLVHMKLQAFRDQDRVHLRDLIEVGLVGRSIHSTLPTELAARLDSLLKEFGL